MSPSVVNSNAVSQSQIAAPVIEQLLNHLGEEKTSLAAMLSAVRDVHQALKTFDDTALRQSLEIEARELSSNSAVQQRRHELQDELATMLHVPAQEITLRRLVTMTTGSARDAIEQIWQSLRDMATELERLNHQNAAIIGQSLSIARGVVERLTGVTAANESYNAAGARTETHVGPLIQWGG